MAPLFRPADHFTGPTHPERFAQIPDPDDRKFAALADATGAVLISNDEHLLGYRDRMNLTVLTPSELWKRQPHGSELGAPMVKKRWSQRVTEHSNALDLDPKVFTRADPRSIARALLRSAERSQRRKADPYRSPMSMLTFYINRAGKTCLRLSVDDSRRRGRVAEALQAATASLRRGCPIQGGSHGCL